MKPVVIESFGGYEFKWDNGLIIRVKRPHLHKDNRITGDVTAMLPDGEGKLIPVYPPSQVNFMAPRTRKELANSLQSKLAKNLKLGEMANFPCELIVDQLCYGVEDRIRKSEDVQEMWTSDPARPLEYLLHPVIMRDVPTIIFGDKGAAKSTLCHLLYLCLILPWDNNPFGFKAPQRAIPSLILDWELPGYIAHRNLKSLQEGMKLPPVPLYHRRCRRPLIDELDEVADQISKVKAECIFIDSLARACGGDIIKDTDRANQFFEALDKLNTTAVIIAQTSKDIETRKKTPYGNALFTYYARSIFELCKSEYAIGGDEISIALFHRWSNLSKNYPPMGFNIYFNETKTIIKPEKFEAGEYSGKVAAHKLIIDELLTAGPALVKDIAENTELSENNVRVTLARLKKRGLVQKLEDGEWGCTTHGV